MLTREGCERRRKRLWETLPEKPDWIVLSDPQHLFYLANFWVSPFVFRANDAGAVLILGRDGLSTLVADNLLSGFAEKAFVSETVLPVWYRGAESASQREAQLVRSALDRLSRCAGTHLGVELASVPAGVIEGLREQRPGLRFTSVDAALFALRRRKEADEVELLRRSMQAGEAGMAAALRHIHAGMTELDAYLVVQNAAVQAAGEQVVVYGDFVSGPRCEQIGGPPGLRKIEKGDLVLLDFSVVLYHYRGDFANTFVCDARPTAKQHDLYLACLEAMREGEKRLRAGAAGQDVDRAVRGWLAAKHLGVSFPHHVGHGIGLGHPEPPFFVPQSTDTLVPGDVVTLEPGQYINGLAGMRYERNYLITEEGYELLSRHELTIEAA